MSCGQALALVFATAAALVSLWIRSLGVTQIEMTCTPPHRDPYVPKPAAADETVRIPSLAEPGVHMEAWLFMPKETATAPPLVIMAHGLGGRKWMGLSERAAEYKARGWAALSFDFRRVGNSEGQPRGIWDAYAMKDDYRSVLRFAATALAGKVDTGRIVVWATCYGAGSASLMLAEEQERADGVTVIGFVAITPFLSVLRAASITGLVQAHDGWTLVQHLRWVYWALSGIVKDMCDHRTGVWFSNSLHNPSDARVVSHGAIHSGAIVVPGLMDLHGGNQSSLFCVHARNTAYMSRTAFTDRESAFVSIKAPILMVQAMHEQVTQAHSHGMAVFKRRANISRDKFVSLNSDHLAVYPVVNWRYYEQAKKVASDSAFRPEAYGESLAAEVDFISALLA